MGKSLSQKIQVSLALVCTLGLLDAYFLLSPPSQATPLTTTANQNVDKRSPASENLESPKENVVSTIDLKCLEPRHLDTVTTANRHVRLTGKFCNGLSEGDIEITNRTTGFVATVFPVGPSGFTSDYLRLEPGVNEIELFTTAHRVRNRLALLTVYQNSQFAAAHP